MRHLTAFWRAIFLMGAALALSGCASVWQELYHAPLSEQQVSTLVSRIRQEDGKVASFFAQGRLQLKDWYWEAESEILIVAERDPFRVKLEVTHGWGQPILHILIDRGRLEVLSFQEGKLYVGDFTPEALSRFMPGPLDRDLIWAFLRGYPGILSHTKTVSPGGNRISFLDEQGAEVERIEFDTEGLHPARVSLPGQDVVLGFSELRESGGILYARVVSLEHGKTNRRLSIGKDRMVFNKPIPQEIFLVEKPPGFAVLSLDAAR